MFRRRWLCDFASGAVQEQPLIGLSFVNGLVEISEKLNIVVSRVCLGTPLLFNKRLTLERRCGVEQLADMVVHVHEKSLSVIDTDLDIPGFLYHAETIMLDYKREDEIGRVDVETGKF
ncbi:hypothetical protein VNO78_26995 [Psophocarpus tetragonolobus]|uniref:Uncharacterized protein n=1 Tax=Psophocarpus tetragonolobus TaxID=3891 RepID=A0AAN9S0D9_PSOTE